MSLQDLLGDRQNARHELAGGGSNGAGRSNHLVLNDTAGEIQASVSSGSSSGGIAAKAMTGALSIAAGARGLMGSAKQAVDVVQAVQSGGAQALVGMAGQAAVSPISSTGPVGAAATTAANALMPGKRGPNVVGLSDAARGLLPGALPKPALPEATVLPQRPPVAQASAPPISLPKADLFAASPLDKSLF